MTDDTAGEVAGESIFKNVKIEDSTNGLFIQNGFASCDLFQSSKITDVAVTIRGGNLVMTRSTLSESSTGLVVNSGFADLDDVDFEKCETGIRFETGFLELERGSVNDGQIGICMLDATCNLSVVGTRVSKQQLFGLQVPGGNATLNQTIFEDNGTAIVATGKVDRNSELNISNGTFRNQNEHRLQIFENSKVKLDNCKSDTSAQDLIFGRTRQTNDNLRLPD
jgi:hypothetical protein